MGTCSNSKVVLLVTYVFHPHVLTVLDGAALRIDDRLRVAKERREEADKQQGKSRFRVLWSFKPSWTTDGKYMLFLYLNYFLYFKLD